MEELLEAFKDLSHFLKNCGSTTSIVQLLQNPTNVFQVLRSAS